MNRSKDKTKIIKAVALVVAAALMIAGLIFVSKKWNYDFIDTEYGYDYAIIRLANGEVVEGKVEKWRDYEDGDQIQVTVNGKTYLVHSANVDLISE